MKKKALLICPFFFNYHNDIRKEFINKGYECHLFSDRAFNSNLFKFLIRLNKKLFSSLTSFIYKRSFFKYKNYNPEIILIINGEGISSSVIKFLRNFFPSTKLVFYTWDSIQNKNGPISDLDLFDSVWSFDKKDCEYWGFKFLPLFFVEKLLEDSSAIKYDLAFIGTVHSDRLSHLIKIFQKCSGMVIFKYMYLQSRLIFIKNKFFSKAYKSFSMSDFKFKALSHQKVYDVIKSSKAILDFSHPNQSGLTMRTIECIGLKKKIITTNLNIKDYDFFHEENILILDDSLEIDPFFLSKPYKPIEKDIYKKYSLSSWLDNIIHK